MSEKKKTIKIPKKKVSNLIPEFIQKIPIVSSITETLEEKKLMSRDDNNLIERNNSPIKEENNTSIKKIPKTKKKIYISKKHNYKQKQ